MTPKYRVILSVVLLSACAGRSHVEVPEERGTPDETTEVETDRPDAAAEPEPPSVTDVCLDSDGDGYGPGCAAGDDCAPLDPLAHSEAGEICADGHDNDCDGLVDEGCACDPTQNTCPAPPTPSTQTLGEFVFELSRGFMALDMVCGPERVTALDAERQPIVSSIDGMVTTNAAVTMGEVAREVLDPLIKSGDLKSTTHAFTDATALLVDDAFDPERRTLSALAQLLESDSLLDERHVLSIAEGVLADQRVPSLVHALAELGAQADGSRVATSALLSVLSDTLDADSATQSCTGLSLQGLSSRLLDVRDMPERAELGAPAWVVDEANRNQVFDAKRTGLAVGLELARDALAAGVHRDLTVVLDAALGPQEACGADCLRYPSAENPVADVAYVAADLLRYDETKSLLQAVSVLLREKPELAESLLVAVGKLTERVRAADVQLDSGQLIRLTRELLPLLARIFESNAETPRLLMEAVHKLGHTARDFPERLKWTIDYAELKKAQTCSDTPPDFVRSRPVDYAQPRGTNNRSSLEQVIELLAAVDCGSVPFSGGKSVGVFVLDTVAKMKPSTVCGVTDVLLGALDVTGVVGDFFTKIALRTIGCSNPDRVLRELDSLEDLAASGALDFLIPLDKIFADKGQLKTLVAIFTLVADDLARDDDGDPGTHSVFRPLLPVVSALIEEGTADAVFDLLDVLVTVETTDAQGRRATLADVLVDSAAFVMTQRSVPTRAFVVNNTSYLSELLGPTERLIERLDGSAVSDTVSKAAGHLTDHVTGYLRATPEDKLEHAELLLFARALLDGVVDVWSLPRAQRDCYVNGWTKDAEALWTSESLATSVRLLRLYTNSEQSALIDAVVVDLLNPLPGTTAPGTTAPSIFTPLLQVLAELAALPPPSEALRELTPYLSKLADPARLDGSAILHTVDTLLQHDPQRVFLGIMQKAVAQGQGGNERARAATLLEAYTNVLAISPNACSAEHRPWSAHGLDSAVQTSLSFMRDPNYGLDAIFDALEAMSAQP